MSKQANIVDRAIAWAMARVGSTEYATLCYAFLEDAYELGNDVWLDGRGRTATEAADAYNARDHGGIPPRGAYVCYECWGEIDGDHRNWGHMGLSLGDGMVVHAWGPVRVDHYLAIEELDAPGWTLPAYAGWVPVPLILRGSSKK